MTSLRIAIETTDAVRSVRAAQDSLRALGAQAQATDRDVLVSAQDIRNALGDLAAPAADPFQQLTENARAFRAELARLEELRAFDDFLEGPTVAASGGRLADLGFTEAELGGTVDALRQAREESNALGTDLARIGTIAPASFGSATASVEQLAAETRRTVEVYQDLFSLQQRSASANTGGIGAGLVGPTFVDARGTAIIEAQARGYAQARSGVQQYATSVQQATASANGSLDLHLRSILRISGAILGIQGARAIVANLVAVEQGVVAVGQSTGIAGPELEGLRQRIVDLSTQLPVAATDLLRFAEAAGRLQIRTPEGVEQFVRDLAQLQTIAPGLGGGPAQIAEEVGRFLRTVGEAPSNVQALSDSVARLGDEFGASEAAIFATASEIAQAGAGFIKASADALGLGAALAQAGVQGGQAGSAIAQIMVAVRDAVAQGGQELQTLADLTGQTGAQIQTALRADAATLFVDVLEGLARQGGESARALDDLGLAGVRQARILGPLIQSTGELRRALEQSRDAQATGGDAAKEAGEAQATLGFQLSRTRNVVLAATGANQGLASGLSQIVGVANDAASALLGVSRATGEPVELLGLDGQNFADMIKAAAAAGTLAAATSKLAPLFATTAVATEATSAALGVYGVATTAAAAGTTTLSAALVRARIAFVAFLASPAGIAVAAAAAVGGLILLHKWLDETGEASKKAAVELSGLTERMGALDRVAQGLSDARDIVFRAELTGDAEVKAQGLQARLRELEAASTVIASEIRLNVEGVEPEFRRAFQAQSESGAVLVGSELEQRMNAAIAAAVAALQIPGVSPKEAEQLQKSLEDAFAGVPPETVARLRASVAEAVSAAQIPAGKLEALRVDELLPDVQGAGLNFGSAVEDALVNTRESIAAERAALQAELEQELRVNPSQFAGASLQAQIANLSATTTFADRLAPQLEAQVGELFGPRLGERARAALEQSLAGAVEGVDADALRIDLEAIATGEVDDEGVARLADALERAGASGIGAADAIQAVQSAIEATQGQLDLIGKKEPEVRPSDFYVEESKRIEAAIRDAELSIGRLSISSSVDLGGGETLVQAGELRGLEARRAALIEERAEYEELISARLKAAEIKAPEADGLRNLADSLTNAKDAALLFEESQRRIGVEQELLAGQSGLLDAQLQQLGLTAQGDTSAAFAIMRRQIELAREAAENDIELRVSAGVPQDEIDSFRQLADAQRDAALRSVELQEYLAENRRSIDDLAGAAQSFGSNATDAILGLKDPLQAVRDFAIDLARQFLEPRLQALFLEGFGGGSNPKAAAAAQQVGVGDLISEVPAPKPIPEIELPAQQVPPPLDISPVTAAAQTAVPALEQLGPAASGAALGLDGLGPSAQAASTGADLLGASAQTAAGGADRLTQAATLAAQALERLASLQAIPGAPVAEQAIVGSQGALDLFTPSSAAAGASIGLQAGAGPSLDLPEIVGLDAFESGAEDAARASAAASSPLQALGQTAAPAAAEALGSIPITAADGAEELAGLAGVARDAAQPIRLLGSDSIQSIAQARTALSREGFELGANVAAGAAGGALPPSPDSDIALAPLQAAGDEVALSMASASEASQVAAVGIGEVGASSEIASAGIGAAGISGEVSSVGLGAAGAAGTTAAAGMTTAQVAVFGTVAAFNAATQAAAVFAAQVGLQAASSFIPGAKPFAMGGVPGVPELSGSIVSSPTYALIGEGSDREAIMPLDSSGGVRGVGPGGQSVSLELTRDSSGKMGVAVPPLGSKVREFALGGIPGLYDSGRGRPELALAGISGAREFVTQDATAQGGNRLTVNNNSAASETYQFTSHYHFHGNVKPDAGFKRSARQHEQDLRDRTRNALKGRG